MARGQRDVWRQSLSDCEWKPSSAQGRKSRKARTSNQSAPVSGEGGDQGAMEAPVLVALSGACRRRGAASPCK